MKKQSCFALLLVLLSPLLSHVAHADLSCSLAKGGNPFLTITGGSITIANLNDTVEGAVYPLQWKLDNNYWADCNGPHGECRTRHLSIDQDYPSFALDIEWMSHDCCVKEALSYISYDDQNCLNCQGEPTKEVVYCSGDLN